MTSVIRREQGRAGTKGNLATAWVACLLMVGILPHVASPENGPMANAWTVETVDSPGNVGQCPSIAVDGNGYPHIAYVDLPNGYLKYASWNGSAWNIEKVDWSFGIACTVSIALDWRGYPQISYHNSFTQYLDIARWTGTSWDLTAVDTVGDVGFENSIAIDSSGYAHISYLDFFGTLKYARWTGTGWSIETIDSGGDYGAGTSIALTPNYLPRIAYADLGNTGLKYARWDGSGWYIETVDPYPTHGGGPSIALDSSGNAGISYLNVTGSPSLMFARSDGFSWHTETIGWADSTETTSMSFDSNDNPHIAFARYPSLGYASWTGTSWNIETVSVGGDVTSWMSMDLDNNGCAHVAFYDGVNGDLKYANNKNHTPNKPSRPSGQARGIVSASYAYSTSATDPDGDQVMYTFNWDDGNMSDTGYMDSGTTASLSHNWSVPGTYLLRAKATDAHGAPSAWSDILIVTIIESPDAPKNLTATPRNQQILLSWLPPDYDGGSPIVNYTVYRGTASGAEAYLASIGAVLNYTDLGLTNGQTYFYTVSATNAAGEGPESNETDATPIGAPGAPIGLTAVGGDRLAVLDWSPPTDDGGSPILNYMIYRGTTPGFERFITQIGNVTTFTNIGLSNGQTYYYMVAAENAAGEGLGSNEASATPMTVPGSPSGLAAVAGDGQVDLTWLSPSDDGGSPIINYTVYRGLSSGGESLLARIGNILTYRDTQVTDGVRYYYEVAAINIAGEGPKSAEANATPAGVPTEPRDLSAQAGNHQVNLSWVAPASEGGSPIANYRLFRGMAPGAEAFLVEVGDVLTYTDAGLTNGVTYYYRVSAKNDVGEGPESNEAEAIPVALPGLPIGLEAIAGDEIVRLTWLPPVDDGGSPITGYRVYRGTAEGAETFLALAGTDLNYTDTNVTNGQTYYYTVSAVNGVGEGPPSGRVNATPTSPPGSGETVNYKPLVAAMFALILLVAGSWSSKIRPWKGGKHRMAVAKAFIIFSLPFVLAEAVTGVVSFATGQLSIPPLFEAGTIVDLTILMAGLGVPLVRVSKTKPSEAELPRKQDD